MSTEIRNTLSPNFSMVQKVNFNFDPANEQIVFVFLVPMFLLRGVTSQDLQPLGEVRETIHSTHSHYIANITRNTDRKMIIFH